MAGHLDNAAKRLRYRDRNDPDVPYPRRSRECGGVSPDDHRASARGTVFGAGLGVVMWVTLGLTWAYV